MTTVMRYIVLMTNMPKSQYLNEKQVYNIALREAQNIAPLYGVNEVQLARAATAICYIESGYNILAKNKHSTARGIGQLLLPTQQWIENKLAKTGNNPTKVFEPEYSIQLIEHYLGYQYMRYDKDWGKAIFAYNQGSYNPKRTQGASYARKWSIALNSQSNSNNYASNSSGKFYLEFL
jgi:hypothetical protein